MHIYSFYDREDGPLVIRVHAESYKRAVEIVRIRLGYVPEYCKVSGFRE